MSAQILICGASGQLAWELQRSGGHHGLTVLGRDKLDISCAESVEKTLAALQPAAIINAAAYTAVDKAESEPDAAFAINERGIANLARFAATDTYLLHISTDFVFDGQSYRAYRSTDPVGPLSVYGKSKLAGEEQLRRLKPKGAAIIRTSWVYSSHGANFVKTMLRFMAEKPKLGIVADQIGTPTWAKVLAQVCWACVEQRLEGTYHWSDAGVASWYDFAQAIQSIGLELGLLKEKIPVHPIATEDYPLPAQRPKFSVLDKKEILAALPQLGQRHWREALCEMMAELKESS